MGRRLDNGLGQIDRISVKMKETARFPRTTFFSGEFRSVVVSRNRKRGNFWSKLHYFDLLCLFWLLMTIKTLSVNSSEISWSDKLIICLENWGERIIFAMLNESTQRRLTTYRNSVNVQDIKKLQEKRSWYFVSSAQIRSRLMKSFKVPTLNRTSRKLKIDIHKINKNVLNSKSITYTLNLCQPPWCMRNFCNFMELFLHFFIFQELYPVGICDCRNLHG